MLYPCSLPVNTAPKNIQTAFRTTGMLRATFQPYVSDYVNYVCELLQSVVGNDRLVIVGPIEGEIPSKALLVGINFEHTLVSPGGRHSDGAPLGIVRVIDSPETKYTVRIANRYYLSECDLVIDYSIPNCFHVRSSRKFPEIAKRQVYIAPCLYPIVWNRTGRTIDILTTFLDTSQPRRKALLESAGSLCTNVSSCFEGSELCRLYQSAKILINIHQTPHHHTLEELRVLPAIQNGVIVLAEKSPLFDLVPYHDCIVWVTYETALDVAKTILAEYDDTWSRLFTPKMRGILESLHESNCEALRQKIRM